MKHRRDKLVTLRKNKGWYQKDVVNELKKQFNITITESYYGMIEQGVRTPKLEIALAIAKLFDVDPNEIFFDVKPNKKLGLKLA
ncbi:transcriptional regulator [Bacillus methanolicus]|uniref:helix-turn-helix transcriptional regulator n=1 Tax=Bacillus methanolicus TaxID=1471 RepID=UPI00200D47E5|nr:helix-turn-helix transcriptional regulator [Bacillus methanolicus]UQD52340.1 transcriptional regulator [Bacillus methanolicus]